MNMYKVELEDKERCYRVDDRNFYVDYETADSPLEALELTLGRMGISVSVKSVQFENE